MHHCTVVSRLFHLHRSDPAGHGSHGSHRLTDHPLRPLVSIPICSETFVSTNRRSNDWIKPSNIGILVQQQWLGFNGLNQTWSWSSMAGLKEKFTWNQCLTGFWFPSHSRDATVNSQDLPSFSGFNCRFCSTFSGLNKTRCPNGSFDLLYPLVN